MQVDSADWVHLHPEGFFDASPEAMDVLASGYYADEFASLKDKYWVPGLWEKVMKGKRIP